METQLGMFATKMPRSLPNGRRMVEVPAAVQAALEKSALLAVSVSGGKDSQTMLEALANHPDASTWTGDRVVLHADLKRAEWSQTPGHVRFISDKVGFPLQVVARPQGDLLDEIRKRVVDLAGTDSPVWPSAKTRYCTSDQKRAQLDKAIRNPWPTSSRRFCTADQKRDQLTKVHRSTEGGIAVAAIGMRAEEGCKQCRKAYAKDMAPLPHKHSGARSKRAVVSVNQRVTSTSLRKLDPAAAVAAWTPGKRLVLDWLPIHEWTLEDVWVGIGHSGEELKIRQAQWKAGEHDLAMKGWIAHPAYVMGNVRLSCGLCVLGCDSDLENGGRHNPELLQAYVEIEMETGWSFKKDRSLASLSITKELYPELAEQASLSISRRRANTKERKVA